MRDLHSNIKVVQHFENQVVSADVTPAAGVDLHGFDAAEFVIDLGEAAGIASGNWTFKLQESDASGSGFTDVLDQNVVLVGSAKSPVAKPDTTTGVFLTVDDAAEDAAVYRVGYIGYKRYVRCVAIATSSPGNTPMGMIAILGLPHLKATSD